MHNESGDRKNGWKNFKPLREERRETGLLGRLLMLAFFCATGALAGAVIAFLLPFMLPLRSRRTMEADPRARSAIGGAIGAVFMTGWALKSWRSAKR